MKSLLTTLFLLASFPAFAKVCTTGKPCGDTCISIKYTCHTPTAPTTTLFNPPGAPTIASGSATHNSATLNFFAPSSSGSAAISSYKATCSAANGTLTASAAGSPITITGLSASTPYACVVQAVNLYGAGSGSSGYSFTTSPAPAPEPAGTAASLLSVHDGDTIFIDSGGVRTRIRLVNIDAPELSQSWGKESKQCLVDLLLGKSIRFSDTGKDRYGRTLAVVYAGSVNANLKMVENGCAWMYRQYTNDAAYDAAERAARGAGIGLWSQANPQYPPDFRKHGPASTSTVFGWAMARYDAMFSGSATIEASEAGAERWIFSDSQSGLARDGGRVQLYGPLLGFPVWTDIGALDDYQAFARADSD